MSLSIRGFVCLLFVFACSTTCKGQHGTMPLLWQADEYNMQSSKTAIQTTLDKAKKVCNEPMLSIVDKDKTYAPNKHYFCSLSPYWWPDPEGGSKYVNRDGKINPEYYEYADRQKFEKLASNLKALSIAYFISGDKTYYDTYIRQIRVWFIDKDTYMYPNVDYGQIVPGHYNNKGRSNAVIEVYGLNDVLDSYRLISSVKLIDRKTKKAFKKWLSQLLDWLIESPQGKESYNGNANTSVMYDVLVCNIAEFVGNKKVLSKMTNTFGSHRIETQIAETGEQPNELKRARSYSYSVYNLIHILDFCFIQEALGNHFYLKYSQRIDKSFKILMSYISNGMEWPYQQITPIDQDMRLLQKQYERLKRLREITR